MTALLKKRLKLLILLSLILIQVKRRHKNLKSQLPHFQILYPVIGVIVAVVVSWVVQGQRLIIILIVVTMMLFIMAIMIMLYIMAIMMMLNMMILMMTR